MRIAILTDMHIGYTGESRWHNRKMWTEAPDVTRAAVVQVNTLDVDQVVVLGDLTESGEPQEVEAAYNALSKLTSAWVVLSGNHDRKAYDDGSLKAIFGEHFLPGYREQHGVGMLFVPELWPRDDKRVVEMDWARLESQVATILAAPPQTLALFAHYSLLNEEFHPAAHNGLYAGHWSDSDVLIERLRPALAGRIVCFCGHQHFHHIMQQDDVLHCTTASLIEYPMECRLVEIDAAQVRIETLPTASPAIAAASLDSATWVRGEASDRTAQVMLPLKLRD